MSRLNDNQVERLLKESARWEPDAQMPESLIRSALTQSPRRRRAPLLPALSLSGAAFAGLMAFVVFRPEVPPTVVEPTPAVVQGTPKAQETPDRKTLPSKPAPTVPQKTQVADNTEKSSAVSKPVSRREKPLRKRTHGKRRPSEAQVPEPKQKPVGTLEYAPSTYTNEPKPLPDDAIALDESPKIVPVVVADTDPETGEVLLRPAVATVPDPSADAPISLE